MRKTLAALAALAVIAVPTAANAQSAPVADSTRALSATPATCAWESIKPCPARRTKLFQFWGKAAEASNDTKSVEIDLLGVGHTGALNKALGRRVGDTVDVRWTPVTQIVKVGFDQKRSKITSTSLLEILEENPRATLYVDARLWPTSNWDDDEPILRAVRIVLDLSDLPAPVAGQGLSVAYFANKDMSGTPAATGIDQTIDFDWGSGGPALLAGKVDVFSIKWTGSIVIPVDGTYTFRTTSDDGVALLIDGTPLLSNWTDHAALNNDVPVTLAAGSHTIEVRYYENGGVATARLSWLTPGAAAFAVVPAAALRTA